MLVGIASAQQESPRAVFNSDQWLTRARLDIASADADEIGLLIEALAACTTGVPGAVADHDCRKAMERHSIHYASSRAIDKILHARALFVLRIAIAEKASTKAARDEIGGIILRVATVDAGLKYEANARARELRSRRVRTEGD